MTAPMTREELLADATRDLIDILEGARSGFIAGSDTDEVWDRSRASRIADAKAALDLDSAQTLGKYQADYSLLTAEEIAKPDQELTEFYANSIPSQGAPCLWCCHVRGPDDVYAAPDYETALAWSDVLNGMNWRSDTHPKPSAFQNPTSYADCLVKAAPAPWPHSAEAHAEDLPKSIAGFAPPSNQGASK